MKIFAFVLAIGLSVGAVSVSASVPAEMGLVSANLCDDNRTAHGKICETQKVDDVVWSSAQVTKVETLAVADFSASSLWKDFKRMVAGWIGSLIRIIKNAIQALVDSFKELGAALKM